MTFVFSHRPPQDQPPVCIGVPIDYEHCLHDIHVLAFSIDFEIRFQYGIVQENFRTISIFRRQYQFRGSPSSRQCLRSFRYLKIPCLWANSTENFRTFWSPVRLLLFIGPAVGLYQLKWSMRDMLHVIDIDIYLHVSLEHPIGQKFLRRLLFNPTVSAKIGQSFSEFHYQ